MLRVLRRFVRFSSWLGISILDFSYSEVKKKDIEKETCAEWEIHWISNKNPYYIPVNHGSLIQLLTTERMGKEGSGKPSSVFPSLQKDKGKTF